MSTSSFEQVVEMASQLPPEEQLKLVVEIEGRLRNTLTTANSGRGSAGAVLQAVREPPHLEPADVDELEQTIAAGRLPTRREGAFDPGGDE